MSTTSVRRLAPKPKPSSPAAEAGTPDRTLTIIMGALVRLTPQKIDKTRALIGDLWRSMDLFLAKLGTVGARPATGAPGRCW